MCQTANADKDVAAMTGFIEHDTHNLNRDAIIATLHDHRPKAQLLYATFEDKIGSRVPYAIFVDWESRRVVLSFRGTLSISDCITDLIAIEMKRKEKRRRYSKADSNDNTSMDSYMSSYGAKGNDDDDDDDASNVQKFLSSAASFSDDADDRKEGNNDDVLRT